MHGDVDRPLPSLPRVGRNLVRIGFLRSPSRLILRAVWWREMRTESLSLEISCAEHKHALSAGQALRHWPTDYGLLIGATRSLNVLHAPTTSSDFKIADTTQMRWAP